MVPKTVRLVLFALMLACAALPARADSPVFPAPQPSWTAADWNAFSQNLVAALAGDNEGVKLSALQMIVRHGERLDVRAAQFDVVRLVRGHPDRRVRRLAAVACGCLKSRWAIGFLRQSEPFEKDDQVRATMRSLVTAPR